MQCERCVEWSRLGLSDTCPSCDKWLLENLDITSKIDNLNDNINYKSLVDKAADPQLIKIWRPTDKE